jgi:hypothetical protein
MGKGQYVSTHFKFDTRWRWVVSFNPALPLLYPEDPGTHWIGCVAHRAGLYAVAKRENPALGLNWIPIALPVVSR